ncbi:MAG: hypothetical protein V4532_19645 [Pseudomonadota bacterium]
MNTITDEKLCFLGSRNAHPDTGGPIELIETHMSWVVLAGERALKLKKPVRTDWFDFSTLKARELNAREELRLNRRLAPEVYLGLLALTCQNGHYALVDEVHAPTDGSTVDWLVHMQRLPPERMLDQMITAGRAAYSDIDALVDVLARFYRYTTRSPLIADDYIARFASELTLNRRVLLQPRFALDGASTLLDAFGAAIQEHKAALRIRVLQKRLVDGHGDLRPEHVCLLPTPVVIDALEFSAALRQVDPLDELAYLGLECDLIGAPWVAGRLRSRYSLTFHDPAPIGLMNFYTASRALLRARLCVVHLLDVDETRATDKWLPRARLYLERARRALQLPVSKPTPHGLAEVHRQP